MMKPIYSAALLSLLLMQGCAESNPVKVVDTGNPTAGSTTTTSTVTGTTTETSGTTTSTSSTVPSDEYEGDEPGECSDGADNDRDGLFDCDDEGCAGSPDCAGKTDTGVSTPTSTSSSTQPVDTDGDGITDTDDQCPGLDDTLWEPTTAGDRCIAVFADSEISWQDAEAQCVDWGGNLMRIANESDDLQLLELSASLPAPDSNGHIWIGYEDLDYDGVWYWTDGEPTTYTNWLAGEPGDGFRGDLCGVIHIVEGSAYYGQWNDMKCPGDGVGDPRDVGYACQVSTSI